MESSLEWLWLRTLVTLYVDLDISPISHLLTYLSYNLQDGTVTVRWQDGKFSSPDDFRATSVGLEAERMTGGLTFFPPQVERI